MKISEFKATCLAVLARVSRTGKPVLVTRFGRPVAQIVPPPRTSGHAWLGTLRDQGTILGDLIEPATAASEWEVLGDARLLGCPDIEVMPA